MWAGGVRGHGNLLLVLQTGAEERYASMVLGKLTRRFEATEYFSLLCLSHCAQDRGVT